MSTNYKYIIPKLRVYKNQATQGIIYKDRNMFYRSLAQAKYGDENQYKKVKRNIIFKTEMYMKEYENGLHTTTMFKKWLKDYEEHTEEPIKYYLSYIEGYLSSAYLPHNATKLGLDMIISSVAENKEFHVFKPYAGSEGTVSIVNPITFGIETIPYSLYSYRNRNSYKFIDSYKYQNTQKEPPILFYMKDSDYIEYAQISPFNYKSSKYESYDIIDGKQVSEQVSE